MEEYTNNGEPSIKAVLITVVELATLLQVSTRTVWRMRSSGQLPLPLQLGGAIRWRLEVIQKWIEEGCPFVRPRDNGSHRSK
jgi:excisionase family DNA binding protein